MDAREEAIAKSVSYWLSQLCKQRLSFDYLFELCEDALHHIGEEVTTLYPEEKQSLRERFSNKQI